MSISSVVQESQGNPRHVLAMRAEDFEVARAEGSQMPVLGRMKRWKSILICYFPREASEEDITKASAGGLPLERRPKTPP